MKGSLSIKVTTSMTINPPAAILLAMYIVRGGKTGGQQTGDRGNDSERHAEGIHRPEDLHASAKTLSSDHRGYRSSTAPGRFRAGIRSASADTISGRPGLPRSRNSPLPWPMALLMWKQRSREASGSMISPQDSLSSSIPTSTSSKRSRSSEQPEGCGLRS